MGLGGVRIYSNVYLKEGKQIEIKLCFPKGNWIVATVRVVWISPLPPGSGSVFDVGLEFIDLRSGRCGVREAGRYGALLGCPDSRQYSDNPA